MTAVILISLVWLALILKGLSDGPRSPSPPAPWERDRDRDWARMDAELHAHG
jgi:hypothetical protein